MAVNAYAAPETLFGTPLPKVGRQPQQRSLWGDIALLAFLLAQCLDGMLTYMGVAAFGIEVEANPIVAGLMTHLGYETGLLSAKLMAGTLGICLHLCEIHTAVAILTAFYVMVAIAPWTLVLFF